MLRVDALADADAPAPTAEGLILAAETRIEASVVHVLDRNRDTAILELALDAIQERNGVVGGLLVRHAAALAADRDDRLCTLIRNGIDEGPNVLLELTVNLGVNDAVLEGHRPGAREQRLETMLAKRRPVGLIDEVEAVAAEPCRLAALIVERQLGIGPEIDAPKTLLDPALTGDLRLGTCRPVGLADRKPVRQRACPSPPAWPVLLVCS